MGSTTRESEQHKYALLFRRVRLTRIGFSQVLLLSGPPGLGKTTLAQVLARQAGYQVLEINASDARTGQVVEERIRNALDSQALTTGAASSGKGKAKAHEEGRNRPTCVIVDEIDGAAGGGESVRPAAFALFFKPLNAASPTELRQDARQAHHRGQHAQETWQ